MNRLQWIAMVTLATALFVGGWFVGSTHEQSSWQAEKLAMSATRDTQINEARKAEAAMREQVRRAQEDAQKREEKLVADAAAAGRAADGLRSQIASLRRGLSAATAEANRRTADAALDVFQQCADEYRAVAQAADQHASDAVTLDQAWPASE